MSMVDESGALVEPATTAGDPILGQTVPEIREMCVAFLVAKGYRIDVVKKVFRTSRSQTFEDNRRARKRLDQLHRAEDAA